MAEHVILLAGTMGVGKTTAIRAISDTPVVSTEATNTDKEQNAKETTTVALDYGEISISDEEKLRIYGLPGQTRFAFMWQILVKRAIGLVLMIDNTSANPLKDLEDYLGMFSEFLERGSAIIAVTRDTHATGVDVGAFAAKVAEVMPGRIIPVLPMDPRDGPSVRLALMSLIATIEMESHFVGARSRG